MNAYSDYHSTQLMVDTEEWGLVHSGTSSTSVIQSTGVVVAHVKKGDDVFVKTSNLSHGILYSNINGRALFADENCIKQKYNVHFHSTTDISEINA